MPYGLVNAPSVFQGYMNEVFREFLHQFVIVYIDDILIYSKSLDKHHQHVQMVLSTLRKHQLFLKAEKCSFHQKSISFLGYEIDSRGVRMNTNKVEAITSWPIPRTIKELQKFLGFANFYRRFIQNYSSVAAPLTDLLKKGPKHLQWNERATLAFNHLKRIFTSAPLLLHPDPETPFVVEVDASTAGAGAILSQEVGFPPKLQPCAYFSRKFSSREQNYDVGNHELLAIKLAFEEWRHWLEGARHPIVIVRSHDRSS